ncbi:hypothetical protein NLJ89_g5114 [Agrocybe chaxingu]|uniref:Uncharacterized protein n=1 Tax=Agrocybe chaxingu TaxID=84603 RepID=A0A9W8K8S4_9AGAR|nr:hypothetical protein NLJ89_g5114 [Agrocybe chaxingu]
MQPLPLKIFEYLIDTIDEWPDGPREKTLGLCTQVSRSFAHRARKHIFRAVYFNDLCDNPISYAKRFYHIATWTPSKPDSTESLQSIVSLVKNLSIAFCWPRVTSTLHFEHVLSAILQILHGPEHGIESFDLRHSDGHWPTLGLGFRQAVIDLLRSSRLKTVFVKGLIEVPNTVFMRGHITELHLNNVAWATLSTAREATYSARYPLGTVRTHPQFDLLEVNRLQWRNFNTWKSSVAPIQSMLTQLRVLRIGEYHEEDGGEVSDYQFFRSLILGSEDTIEELKVGLFRSNLSMPRMILDLASMKNLKTIHIEDFGLKPETSLEDIECLFDSLTSIKTLNSLCLGPGFQIDDGEEDDGEEDDGEDGHRVVDNNQVVYFRWIKP